MRNTAFRGYCLTGCGSPVFSRSPKAKYCSAACAKMRFEARRGLCAHCHSKLKRHQYKYCSIKCQQAFAFQARASKLENGQYQTLNGNAFIRRYLTERFGERCSRCGWAQRHPKTGRVPVEVEHIDGDWRNNSVENLTLLCPNCHSLTETFRALNRGRGRPHRLGGRENPRRPDEVFKDSDIPQPN